MEKGKYYVEVRDRAYARAPKRWHKVKSFDTENDAITYYENLTCFSEIDKRITYEEFILDEYNPKVYD